MNVDSKKINIKVNKELTELNIKHNLIATESYIKVYEKTKDYNQAFCSMILESIENNDDDLTFDDIKAIDEIDLIRIGKIIINQSEDLLLNYVNNESKTFYENFHEAIIKEYEKYKTKIQSVSNNLNDGIETFKKGINYLSNFIVNQNDISNYKDIMNKNTFKRFDTSSFIKDMKPIENPMNKLLKEQIKENKNIAKILLETEQKNIIRDEQSTKLNKKNLILVTITLIITAISFVVATGFSLYSIFHKS